MALVFPRTPRRSVRVALDVAVAVWTAAWIGLGLWVAREVQNLADLSETVTAAGVALEEAGGALQSLDGVPFVGEDVARVGERTERAGQSARVSGSSSRESVESLSVLLGVSIAVAPSLPLLALYLPMRLAWRRHVTAVRRALARAPDDPALEEFLAWRAVLNLPYDRLRAVSADPWRDLESGRHRRLGDAELARLGIERPAASGR
ncbi:MAG TPA: hypothetical protein VHF23_07040 [Gaiellaceae bacterium]|nr:hypothetical protein [Gaiellaceae bacterium]